LDRRSSRRDLRAAIIVTGTELTFGRTEFNGGLVDIDGPMVAAELTALGVRVVHQVVKPDDGPLLVAELQHALEIGVDVVVTTGGMGSTADDVTNWAVGQVTGRRLAIVPWLRRDVMAKERVYGEVERHTDLVDAVNKQVTLPEGAEPIAPLGTAAAYWLRADGVIWIVLPGPPWEARGSLREILRRHRRALINDPARVERWTIRAFGGDEILVNGALREARAEGLLEQLPAPVTCFAEGGAETTIDLHFRPGQERDATAFVAFLRQRLPVFSEGPTLDELLVPLLAAKRVAVYGTTRVGAALPVRLDASASPSLRLFASREQAVRFAGFGVHTARGQGRALFGTVGVRWPRGVGSRWWGRHPRGRPYPNDEMLACRIAERGLCVDQPDYAIAVVGDAPTAVCLATPARPSTARLLISPQQEHRAQHRRIRLGRSRQAEPPADRQSVDAFLTYELLRLLFEEAWRQRPRS
jgi:molybdenum cofactor synthesis domain-containing protein